MNTALWIAQIVMALLFAMSGLGKLLMPKPKLEQRMVWPKDHSAIQIKLIGTAEVLGAIGLIFPALTKIAPVLTPLAAVGLGVIMLGAIQTHMRLREYPLVVATVVLFLWALFIAGGRFWWSPI